MSKYEIGMIDNTTQIGFLNPAINSLLKDKYDESYCDQTIENDGFTLAYSYKHKAPIFAETIVEWNNFTKKMKRKAGFVKDKRIPKEFSQSTKDYSKSGYEKGHMIPAIMTRRSELAQNQSFFYTNIVPQLRKVNHPVISEIERYAKNITYKHGSIHYLVGCTFGEYCIHRGKKLTCHEKKGIGIPLAMYFIITFGVKREEKCFVVPNTEETNKNDLQSGTYDSDINSISLMADIKF